MKSASRANACAPDNVVVLEAQPARIMASVICGLGLLALVSITLSGLALLLKYLAAAACIVVTLLTLHGLGPGRFHRIELHADHLRVIDQRKRERILVRWHSVFLSAWFIGFTALDEQGRRVRVGLFREQFGREGFRRLSVWFRDRQ